MNFPKELLYTKTHEFVKPDGANAVIGITDYAQNQLGDIVFIELPDVGTKFTKGEKFAVVESVKAVEDIHTPVSGEVMEINDDLEANPNFVNEDPYSKGWLIKIKLDSPDELKELLNLEQYKKFVD